jgi:hypothetical protein
MLGMGEHINRSDAFNFIFLGEQSNVTRLCSSIATYVNDPRSLHFKQPGYYPPGEGR